MDIDSAPATSTPAGVPSLPVVAVAAVLGATALVSRTLTAVRALRDAGASVPALTHRASLGGYGETLRVVVLGDSAAAGHGLPGPDVALARQVGRRLAVRTGRPVEVDSLAVDGATIAAVRDLQVPDLRPDAEVVLIGVGVNDAVRGRSPRRVADEMRGLLRAVGDTAPSADVVLLTCPDLSGAPGIPGLLGRALGASCRRTARAQRRVATELGITTVGADGALPAAAFGPDGFHPGPRGVAILADRVDRALRRPVARGGEVSDARSGPPGRGADGRRPRSPAVG